MPHSSTRVLLVVTSMNVGGIQSYVMNVLRHCRDEAVHIDVCYTGAAPGCHQREVEALGSRLIPCAYSNNPLPFVARLWRVLRTGRYDVLCDFRGDFAAASLWAARLARVNNRIAFYRSSGIQFRPTPARRRVARLLHRGVLRYATTILSNSHGNLASAFTEHEIATHRCAVVYNGVDLTRFRPAASDAGADVRRELGIPADADVIGHVGSFTPPKAHDILVQAFARVRNAHPRARLLLVGAGPLETCLRAQVESLNVTSEVTFAGERADVARLLGAMDVFVMPSRFEGFPNALLEAQALGLPIIASDRPEIREAVPRENHGWLVPVDDAASFAGKIALMLGNRAAAARQGASGAEFVGAHLDITASVRQFCGHLRDRNYALEIRDRNYALEIR